MTIDKSLKVKRGMISSRSVLTRVERLVRLRDAERWNDGDPVIGLPKVRVMKMALKKKKKTKEEGATEGTAADAKKPAAAADKKKK